jgi:hypothetical protein
MQKKLFIQKKKTTFRVQNLQIPLKLCWFVLFQKTFFNIFDIQL